MLVTSKDLKGYGMSKKCNFLSYISPALEKKDHLDCYKIIIIINDQFHFFFQS